MENNSFNSKLGKHKRRVIVLCLPVLLLISLSLFAGSFLSISELPNKADVIIVLSGGAGRIEKGIELYNEDYSQYFLLSNAKANVSSSLDMLQTALSLGIPQKFIFTENESLSTIQNAQLTLPIMKQHGFTSAIIVSSDFHMRRVKLIFDHVYKKSGIKLTFVGADSGYNAKWWWSDRYSRETTFNEYSKMLGNAFGYNGPEAKATLERIKNWFH